MTYTTPTRNGTHPDPQAVVLETPVAPWHYCALCDSPVLAFCHNMGRCAAERRQQATARLWRRLWYGVGLVLWIGVPVGGWWLLAWVLRRLGVL